MRRQQPLWEYWLLVRRHPNKPDQLAYYIVFSPADTSLATLARVAGRRWAIEECFEVAKQEVGLADYEIRSWHGWYRHVTLAMLALAFLAAMRVKLKAAAAATASGKKGHLELDLWSISAQMKSAISSAACNSSPA
jgi:SRSO17 transposase